MMPAPVLLCLLAALALYQLYVSVRVLASGLYSGAQKGMQLGLIWLLPMLGALLCHLLLAADAENSQARERAGKRDTAFTPQQDQAVS